MISLDELIAGIKSEIADIRKRDAAWRGVMTTLRMERIDQLEAILASLKELKRIKELMREPSEALVKDCARRLLQWQDNSTDESFDKLTWAGAKTDARRVIAELYFACSGGDGD